MAAAEILRIDPEFSINRYTRILPLDFINALRDAGLPGSHKILEENRLSVEEIKKLTFGRTITGFSRTSGNEWWQEFQDS